MSLPQDGRIDKLTQECTKPFGHRIVASCWARKPNGESNPEHISAPFQRALSVDSQWLQEPTLAFMLGHAPPDTLINTVLKAANAQIRVYVLAGPDLGEGRRDPGFRDLKHARVLVRRLPHPLPCSAILARRGEASQVWLGNGTHHGSDYSVHLSKTQGAALFQAYLHLFWHQAREEAFGGDGPLTFGPALARPFDALAPDLRAPVRLLSRNDVRFEGALGDTLYDPNAMQALSPMTSLRLILTPAAGSGQSMLAAFAKKGTVIVWEDGGFPPFCIGEDHGMMELGSDPWRLRMTLEPDQARALHRFAHETAQRATFRFYQDVPLERLPGEVWLPNADKPASVVHVENIAAGTVTAKEIREMPTTNAASYREPAPLALSAHYTWSVQPPRVPSVAKEDPLLEQWRIADARAKSLVEDLVKRLDATVSHTATLKRFKDMAGKLLGLGSAQSRLRDKLVICGKTIPSTIGPEDARTRFSEMMDIDEQLRRHADDVVKEEHQAELNEERQRQERAHEEMHRKAVHDLAQVQEDLEQERNRLENGLMELKTREFGDEKERQAALKKREFDATKQIKKLEARVRELEVDVAKPFEFIPPHRPELVKAGGKGGTTVSKFVPQANGALDIVVPTEALPQVGHLRKTKDARYLVIDRWEHVILGEREALRLGARLVAPEE